MRAILLLLLFGICGPTVFGQPDSTTTYAVVVGISDYQDPKIPDLRFADKDAIAFANYLKSPDGGRVKVENIKLLVNNGATAGRVLSALFWVLEASKAGDKFIFYFNGHGDLEKEPPFQSGYLLCWDTPPRDYMAGGSLSLNSLQNVVASLSLDKKVETTLITDSSHGAKSVGSHIDGPQKVVANLLQQYANETMILACQPHEFSLEGGQWGEGSSRPPIFQPVREGEQWAGGHGAFTYHLIRGLAGNADRDCDKAVTLAELDRYLEDHVSTETAPHEQTLMVIGNKGKVLSFVSDSTDIESFFKTDDRRGFAEPESTGKTLDLKAPAPKMTVQYPDLPANHALVTIADSLEIRLEAGNALDYILINQQKIPQLEPKQYAFKVPLKPGLNEIQIAAFKGFRSVADTLLVYSNHSPGLRYGLGEKVKHYALFIGIDRYDDPALPDLNNPVFDARSVAEVLARKYGFAVDTLFNPTKKQILTTLQGYALRFQDQEYLERNDHLLIFFSGHGAWDGSFRQGHWVAADSKANDPVYESYISYADLQNKIDNLKIKHVLVVVDACYSGTFDLELAAHSEKCAEPVSFGSKISSEFVQEKLRFQTRRLLASGRDVPVSDGTAAEHSPFARRFLEALQNPEEGVITMERLQQYLDKSNPVPHTSVFGKNQPGSNFLILSKG